LDICSEKALPPPRDRPERGGGQGVHLCLAERKMRTFPFTLIFLTVLATLAGYALGGWLTFLTVFIAFVVVPLFDFVLGANTLNPTPEEEATLDEARDFKLLTWIAAPVQVALMFWGAWVAGTKNLSWVETAGLTVSVGIVGGAMGINVSHELIHRYRPFETFLGKAMLWSVSYLHWSIEHVAGHHRRVATPQDPATARYGESVYAFLPRTIIDSFISAWTIERHRLKKKGLAEYGFHNRILRYLAATAALAVGLGLLWGAAAVAFFLVQSLVAITLLEIVNYIEHYGLLRRRVSDTEFEEVTPVHSWNASQRLTNYFLFNLQRHSDHHARAHIRYQLLRHLDESPQLPTGYAGMVLLTLVPPLWFAVMNKRVPPHMKDLAKEYFDSPAVAEA